MNKSGFEKIIENGVRFLAEFFPKKSYLYFPLLSAFIVWAIRRNKEWKEKIFSWKIWLDPGFVQAKPDEFILDFFKSNKDLYNAYRDEIKEGKIKSLREAFGRLYPILGLEDPFLSALFTQELESGDYRKIVKDFKKRVSQAKKDVESIEREKRLLEGLNTFADEVFSLNLNLISQANLRKIIADLVKKHIKNGSSPKKLNNNIRGI